MAPKAPKGLKSGNYSNNYNPNKSFKGNFIMKIEKISENKVKITLTIDELSQRHISIPKILLSKQLAKQPSE